MKMFLSAILAILTVTLVGCGQEQFGKVAQTQTSQASSIKTFEAVSCADYTLIKPKVDILYVVDNSTSTYYLASDIKNAIKSTVDYVSGNFDYRIVGIPLISTSSSDYQILTNSTDLTGIPADSRRVTSSSAFTFFETTSSGNERGLGRVYDFMNAHVSDGLFRNGAYHLVVLISNGRDMDIEQTSPYGNGESVYNSTAYTTAKNNLITLKSSSKLNSQQFRILSATARSTCNSGWFSSLKSYVQASKDLYILSGASDQGNATYPDNYDLCSGNVSSIFTTVNSAIQQVTVPHSYRYWPITFAENNESVSLSEIRVYKVLNGSQSEMPSSQWSYYANPSYPSSPLNVRELPTVGEPINGKHFVRFNDGYLVTYPACVLVKSVSRLEYFGYIALDRMPDESTLQVIINGQAIPKSTTNGWSYMGNTYRTQNIKVAYPNAGDENPPVIKSGFMIKLNGSANYYKSGDSVTVNFLPSSL